MPGTTYLPLVLGLAATLLTLWLMHLFARAVEDSDSRAEGKSYPPRTTAALAAEKRAERVAGLLLTAAMAAALMFTIYQGIKTLLP